jgi:glutaredoxin
MSTALLVIRVAICLGSVAAAGCTKTPDDEPAQVAPAAIPQPPAVTDAAGPWILRYFSPASGELIAAKTPAEVPEGARGQVLVAYEDPALQGPWVFVADLSQAQGGKYAVRAVARQEIEAQHAPAPVAKVEVPAAPADSAPKPAAAAVADRDVIIYRTQWCGYCKKAAEYLTLKHIPFVEKDLERDPGARQDMLTRAQKSGVPADRLQGVPILWVRGHLISGFDRNAIDRALGG